MNQVCEVQGTHETRLQNAERQIDLLNKRLLLIAAASGLAAGGGAEMIKALLAAVTK